MLPTSSALKAWKAQEGIADPLVVLYAIEVADGQFLRLAEGDPLGTGSVTYDGQTYQAASIARGELQQSIDGDVPTLQVAVSNIDGVAGGYIETNELDGRPVTITFVPASSLSPSDAISQTFRIQDQSYDRQKAVFTFGHEDTFRRRIPTVAAVRYKCQWLYERRFQLGDGCGFPSDVFGPDTSQSFIVGRTTNAEQKRRFGWHTLNALRAKVWDVDQSTPDFLHVESEQTGIDWAAGIHDGPFAYKRLVGDFDVHSELFPLSDRVGLLFGLCCQEDGDLFDSWVFVGHALKADQTLALRFASAEDAVDGGKVDVTGVTDSILRLKRAGDVFTAYRSADAVSWTQIAQRTVILDAAARLGILLAAPDTESSPIGGIANYIQFLSGGRTTCDRTIAGSDGCRAHDNVHRIRAMPGIPRR